MPEQLEIDVYELKRLTEIEKDFNSLNKLWFVKFYYFLKKIKKKLK